MIAGLDVPTSGRVCVNGRDYRSSRAPMAELGLLLEAKSVHPGRSARDRFLRFMPSNAGGALWDAAFSPTSLSPWTGFALLCGYTAALVAVAAWRLRHGDA